MTDKLIERLRHTVDYLDATNEITVPDIFDQILLAAARIEALESTNRKLTKEQGE